MTNRMSHLTALVWDIQDPTPYSKRAGHGVPDVMVDYSFRTGGNC